MTDKTSKIFLDSIPFAPEGRAVALGFFDGVHKGHEQIIRRAVKTAKMNGLRSTVQTFTGFSKDDGRNLTTVEDKLEIISSFGADELLVINFTDRIRNMEPSDYLNDILRFSLNAKALFFGDDYRFGRGASGNADTIRKFGADNGIRTDVFEEFSEDGRRISSTWLRELLRQGDAGKYSDLCSGRCFSYRGTVTEGKKLGRELGFPTANIRIPADKALAARGVYVSRITMGPHVMYGISNLGLRPTVEDQTEDLLETNIFGFDGDIYGASVRVELLRHIRGEVKFGSKEELAAAIARDKTSGMEYLRNSGIIMR